MILGLALETLRRNSSCSLLGHPLFHLFFFLSNHQLPSPLIHWSSKAFLPYHGLDLNASVLSGKEEREILRINYRQVIH